MPPYHMYIVAGATFITLKFNWISCVQYSYKIAPPTLVATVVSITSTIMWVIGEFSVVFLAQRDESRVRLRGKTYNVYVSSYFQS